MAWLIQRGNSWVGCWLGVDGKEVRRSTRVHVSPAPRDAGMTPKQLKALAQRVADGMEGTDKGQMSVELALSAVRAVACGGGSKPVTLGQFAETFLRSRREQKSYNNSTVAVGSLLRLVPGAKDMPLGRVTVAMAEDYVWAALDEVGGSTVDRRLEVIGAMFNRAVAERLIEVNPFRGVRVPKWALNEASEREPFTREEVQRMLEVLPDEWPDFVAAWLPEDAVELVRWDMVDFSRGLVKVRAAKTNKPMTKPLIKPLRALLERRKVAAAGWSEYVFPYAQLRYAQAGDKSSKLSIEFGNLLKKHGIVEPAKLEFKRAGRARRFQSKSFHSLRTTATTFLLDCGCPAELVRHIVGHDDPAIEREHYYKPQSEVQQGYLQRLSEFLGLPDGSE